MFLKFRKKVVRKKVYEKKGESVCAWCWFARTRRDICGVYCTGGFHNEDGDCEMFLDYFEERKKRRNAMLKTNVVKRDWKVVTKDRKSGHKRMTLIKAESEETARLQIPDGEEILSVEQMGGGDGDPAA